MPRRVDVPASRLVTVRITADEFAALQPLLQRRAEAVRALTGHATISGLLRLMIREATEEHDRLYVSTRPPSDGHWLNLTNCLTDGYDGLLLFSNRAAHWLDMLRAAKDEALVDEEAPDAADANPAPT